VHKLSAKLEADVAHLGYARVSSDGQSLTAQVAELKAAACAEIFQEKVSGAKSDRKQLARLIGRLGKDDVLVVTRLDRLARSTRDLLNLLGAVADKGAGFKSLRDTWADTTTRHGRLMLTVLGGLAEFERELIRSRTSEGREREAQTDAPPAPGSHCATGSRRVPGRYRQVIQRQPQHDQQVVGAACPLIQELLR
jgi:DNA invertase Pin-like site-specific DNA recombinase